MKGKIALVLCALLCALSAFIFISCDSISDSKTRGNMILTETNGLTVEVIQGKLYKILGDIKNMFDCDPTTSTMFYIINQINASTYVPAVFKIAIPNLYSAVISIDVNIILDDPNYNFFNKITLSYVTTDGIEHTFYTEESDKKMQLNKEFFIYNNISYFLIECPGDPRTGTGTSVEFCDFDIHSAPLGELLFKDESGRIWKNLDWDEGYTPLQYCGTDTKIHNVLLVPYFSEPDSPQYQLLASPVRLSLADDSFEFPSEKVRKFAQQFPIMAVAGKLV